MLNEEKVKLMTKMAMYEEKDGQEDLRISAYYRKDYTSYHTIVTIIWITIGYAIAVGIGIMAFTDELMKHFNTTFLIMLALCLVTGYLVTVILYGIVAARFYRNKHNLARQRVKRFNYELTRLNRMYERKQK